MRDEQDRGAQRPRDVGDSATRGVESNEQAACSLDEDDVVVYREFTGRGGGFGGAHGRQAAAAGGGFRRERVGVAAQLAGGDGTGEAFDLGEVAGSVLGKAGLGGLQDGDRSATGRGQCGDGGGNHRLTHVGAGPGDHEYAHRPSDYDRAIDHDGPGMVRRRAEPGRRCPMSALSRSGRADWTTQLSPHEVRVLFQRGRIALSADLFRSLVGYSTRVVTLRFGHTCGTGGNTLHVVAENRQRVRNQTYGDIRGAVVQAGAIQHVWLSEATIPGYATDGEQPLVPRQLPPAVRDFTGRSEHLAVLDALLPIGRDKDPSPAETAVITAIDGMAGIGKTALAVWWAHGMQHEFPDGTLYVDMRGYGPGNLVATTDVLDGFLRALGIPPERMPLGVEAQSGLFRSLLSRRRVLIVLDNANNAEHVRPLLPGTPGSVVIITSRDSMTGLVVTEGASRLTLDLLTNHEAVQLVTGVIGAAKASAEAAAVLELVRWCARLPLALRIAAGRAAAYPHSTVAEIVTQLADEHVRLDALSQTGDERAALRAVFDWSFQCLSADEAHLFRRLGLHPGPEVGVPAAAAVADLDPPTVRRLLDDLAHVHLIESVGQGRYRFHDLLRAYALDQAIRYDAPADREYAQRCLLDWYVHTAHTCDALLYPAHSQLKTPTTVPAHPTPILDQLHGLAWLVMERDNLLAILHHTAHKGLHERTLHLAGSLRFLHALGRWETLLDAINCGLGAAQHNEDRQSELWLFILRGETFMLSRRWDDAQDDFDRALMVARDLGDRAYQAGALADLGHLAVEQGCFEQALPYLQEALPLSRGVDTGRQEAVVEYNLSSAYSGLGQYQHARHHAEIGLAIRRRCGDLPGEAFALHHLARIWQKQGEHQKTIALCREAISLGRATVMLAETVAAPLDTLAVSLHHTGNTAGAIVCWEEAAAIFDSHGRSSQSDQIRDDAYKAATQTQT